MMDRVAVITGAGTGIGRATTLALFRSGWTVVLAGRRAEKLEETAALAAASKTMCVPTDVTNPGQVDALFAAARANFGRVDMLFNNAGTSLPPTNFGDITWEDWNGIVSTNLNAMFLCANAAYRVMRDQDPRGGRIINNGSISAKAPRLGAAGYTTTKHAITGLTKSIALDGRVHDICSCQIDIGNAVTPMSVDYGKGGEKQASGDTVVEPKMDVAHVANQVTFMANLPLEANVQFVTIMATKMPFIGRG